MSNKSYVSTSQYHISGRPEKGIRTVSYQLQLVSTAARQIEKLNPEVQKQIVMKLEQLTLNPLLEEARNLEARNNLYVVTLNNYRIVYQIQEEVSLITVTKVAHHKDY